MIYVTIVNSNRVCIKKNNYDNDYKKLDNNSMLPKDKI